MNMTTKNLRISELPNASSIQMDDFLPIARKLGESDKRATKKLSIEDLLNGIKHEIDFTNIIEEYISININRFNGLIKEVYLGAEKLTISKEGVLIIPDKYALIEEQITNIKNSIITLSNIINDLSRRITNNEVNINDLRSYVDNEYYQKIIDLINSTIAKGLGYLEIDLFFSNYLGLEDIYINNNGNYQILQSKINLPESIFQTIGTKIPTKKPGTYLIFDLNDNFFKPLLSKYRYSIIYELSDNTSENGVEITNITEDYFFFPVHVNVFFNNQNNKLIFFFQETYSFQGLLLIK